MSGIREDRAPINMMLVQSLPDGGFMVGEMGRPHEMWPQLKAATTIDEVLDYLRQKMDPEGYRQRMKREMDEALTGRGRGLDPSGWQENVALSRQDGLPEHADATPKPPSTESPR